MDLSDRGELSRFLARHGLAPRKELGQHFLCSSSVVRSIIGVVPEGAGVLEIGPGPGILTGPLSQRATVRALEVDPRMAVLLAESAPEVEVVVGDALRADVARLLQDLPEPRAVVSNLPYYITGPLLDRIALAREHYAIAVLMMQREVGEKILARPGDRERGAISVRFQFWFHIAKVCVVPPGAFLPPPKVESLVLSLKPKPCDLSEAFFGFVRSAFAQPRKTMANNLTAAGYARGLVEKAGLEPTIRPHQLDDEAWKRLWVTCQA